MRFPGHPAAGFLRIAGHHPQRCTRPPSLRSLPVRLRRAGGSAPGHGTPERVTALVSQNGNAYVEGLSDAWAPRRAYWEGGTQDTRDACRAALTPESTRAQYLSGADATRVAPDGYTLDIAYFARPGTDEIQLDLIYDCRTNVALYPAWQAYLRTHRPPLLAVWGRNNGLFLPAVAEAYRRDVPDAEVHLYDTGHFALETHGPEIAERMLDFLDRKVARL